MAEYDCKTEAANRLVEKIRHCIPEPSKAKAGIFSDNEPGPITKAYGIAGIKDIRIARDSYELFDQVFDIVGLSFANCPVDEAVYLVYDLFRQRRFNSRALLCTNFFGDSVVGYLEERIKEVMSQDSIEGYFMNITKEDRGYVRNNIGDFPLTSALMLCSRTDSKLIAEIIDVDFEPEPKAELNLPVASQVVQGIQKVTMGSSGGFTTRGRAIQCSVEQGEQLIYAAFSNKVLPSTVQDVTNFFYRDGNSNVYWDIMLISDCAELIGRVKPLIRGKDPQGGYVLNGSGREYGVNLRTFSELAREYDKRLNKMYSLIRILEELEDITLPWTTVKEAKRLLQDGVNPEDILSKYRGITEEEMRSLAQRFYRSPQDEVVVKAGNSNVSDGDKSNCEDPRMVKARGIISKGVVIYDSYSGRLDKNTSRIIGVTHTKTTTHIKSFSGGFGLESFESSGVYVLNTFDLKFEEALNYLLNTYINSGERLNLVFLGNGFKEDDIRDAVGLGVDVHFAYVPIRQAYIDVKKPVNLEEVIASML